MKVHLKRWEWSLMNAVGCMLAWLALGVVIGGTEDHGPHLVGQEVETLEVPPSAVAFVHVRWADWWDHPSRPNWLRASLDEDPEFQQRAERALGIALDQLDRLTLVIPGIDGTSLEDSLVLIVTARNPCDRASVLARLGVKGRFRSTIVKLPNQVGLVQFRSERSWALVYSSSRAGQLLAEMQAKAGPGRMISLIENAAKSSHFVTVAADLTRWRELEWVAGSSQWRPFFIARTAFATAELRPNGSVTLRITIQAALQQHIEELADTIAARRSAWLRDGGAGASAHLMPPVARAVWRHGLEHLASEPQAKRLDLRTTLPTAEPFIQDWVEWIGGLSTYADQAASKENLRQLAVALHGYHDVMNQITPAIKSKDGRPLLSWRVAILPQLGQVQLYEQFKMDEPWDSEHNKKLTEQMPKVYDLGKSSKPARPGWTYYRVFVGNNAMFDESRPTQFGRISDGMSNTIMIVEAEEAVPWTQPCELPYDPKKPPKIGFHWGRKANVLMADGAVRTISRPVDPTWLHRLIQMNDGQPVWFPD